MKPKIWCYGITTVPSRRQLLSDTIESLSNAGFNSPHLFVDGLDPSWSPPTDDLASLTIHEPNVGQFGNWALGLVHLYMFNREAEYYAMFEDDLLISKNVRQYIESTYPEDGYLNLLTHAENLVFTKGEDGWHQSNQLGKGAVALVFNNATIRKLILSEMIANSRRSTPADGQVVTVLKPLGIKEYIHHPTLVQHVGLKSVLGHRYGNMPGWRGESYDPTTLLGVDGKPRELPPKDKCIAKMVAPGQKRPNAWRGGIIQIHVTRSCDKDCFGCTQASNLRGKPHHISLEDFEQACKSLEDYWGVVGMFGGNPAVHPKFEQLCEIMAKYIPLEQRGIWCNNPLGKASTMRNTFNPNVSNLNVHLDQRAYDDFKTNWPECSPVGLREDSRHSPPFVALKDVIEDESKRWQLISNCDINKNWSAMLCSVPGRGLRAYFCEVAGAQAILHGDSNNWPDTGIVPRPGWWRLTMTAFKDQVEQHCHSCGIPLRREGQLAVKGEYEETSETHLPIYKPKRKDRPVNVVEKDNHTYSPTPVTTYLRIER